MASGVISSPKPSRSSLMRRLGHNRQSTLADDSAADVFKIRVDHIIVRGTGLRAPGRWRCRRTLRGLPQNSAGPISESARLAYDLVAVATAVDDLAFRHRVFTAHKTWWYRSQTTVDDLVANSPMVELTLPAISR